MFPAYPFVRPILVNSTSQDAWKKFHYIRRKRPRGLKDELIRIWWSKVKGHCDLIKRVLGCNSKINSLIMTKFHTNVQQDKMIQS